jgi:branched-chain amino acid transport system permease protein
MIEFLQNLINALSFGSLLALTALGIGLLFGVLRLVNFAQGDFITAGAFALIVPSSADTPILFIGAWPWPAVTAAVCVVLVALALAADWLVFRHLRKASAPTLMMASFAIGHVIQNVIIVIYTGRPKGIDLWPSLSNPMDIGAVSVPTSNTVIIGVTVVLLGILILFLTQTRLGIQMRAAAEDFRMAQYLGVRSNFVIGLAFAISGILAAFASLFYVAQTGALSYVMGNPIVLLAFMATVIGGMNSLVGAVIGGYVTGFFDVMLQAYLPPELREFRDAFVYGIVLLMIVLKPDGLFPSKNLVSRV